MIYNHLNFKLIKYFSFYKFHLEKKYLSTEDHLFELKKMISLKKNINLTKKTIKKPIYNNIMKNQVLEERNNKKLIIILFINLSG